MLQDKKRSLFAYYIYTNILETFMTITIHISVTGYVVIVDIYNYHLPLPICIHFCPQEVPQSYYITLDKPVSSVRKKKIPH